MAKKAPSARIIQGWRDAIHENGFKRIKVRALLRCFGFERRGTASTARIDQYLAGLEVEGESTALYVDWGAAKKLDDFVRISSSEVTRIGELWPGHEDDFEKHYGEEIFKMLGLEIVAREYSPKCYKIADYIKLKGPMFLEGYQVTLQSYPDYPPILPFKDWDAIKPAQTLSWWQDYNSTKHDRDTKFSKGSFKQALYAVSAAVLLLTAQFGTLTGRRRVGKDVAAEFNVEPARDFPDDYPDDFFYVPRQGQPWQMKKLSLK